MKIAVTGGSGKLGSTLIPYLLAEGHAVRSLDLRAPASPLDGVETLQLELTDAPAVMRAFEGCDAVIHLGAIPSPRLASAYVVHHNNTQSGYNVLWAAAELGIWRVCLASSINAIGGVYSRKPRYDYFPLDEDHPTYAEDPYSLSKWILEQQGDAFARRHAQMSIASLRFHGLVPERERMNDAHPDLAIKHLWGYTLLPSAARACLLGVTASFRGHHALYIVAPDSSVSTPTAELLQAYYPGVPVRQPLPDNASLFDSSRAARILGWAH
ncbi:MAG: NAD(P)-dependent oxidoreductase [Thermoflexales bacterium]